MTTATLAFLIGSAILAQVLAIAVPELRRQRGRYRALASAAHGGPEIAPVLRRAQTRGAPAVPVGPKARPTPAL